MKTTYPEFDCVYSISDLHLSCEDHSRIFFQGERLGEIIANLGNYADTRRLALVINGDFIDFLNNSPVHQFFDCRGAVDTLGRVMDDCVCKPVFDGLRKFVSSPANTLVIIVGNHDLELCLDAVQQALVTRLADDRPKPAGRILFIYDGTGFRCRVGNKTILFTHGNEADSRNRVDYTGLRNIRNRINRGFACDQELLLPALGTMLVTNCFNKLKQKYPFLELIKPEKEANCYLVPLVVDRTDAVVLEVIKSFFGFVRKIPSHVIKNKRFLDEYPDDEFSGYCCSSENTSQKGRKLLLDTFRDVQAKAIPDPVFPDDEHLFLVNGATWLSYVVTTYGIRKARLVPYLNVLLEMRKKHTATPEEMARARKNLRHHVSGLLFSLTREDDISKKMGSDNALCGPEIDFLVTGHTHLRRFINRRDCRTKYYNTGTWVPLIALDKVVDDDDLFASFIKIMKKQELDTFRSKQLINGKEIPPLVRDEGTLFRITHENGACHACLLEPGDAGTLQEVDGTAWEGRV